ncbi:hypothetical protein [Nonomuraea sp. NPDC048916]|uniref:hypothetical protein n=1 Tax=Nonomuraea sp. NPDC048916 TaxID=3154232 RepID=UPI0033CE53E2
MSLSDVIRNIAKTVTDKEKAKDLPLFVVQSTLSAAGQALLLVDRMKNSIKGLAGKGEKEESYDSRPSAADQVAAPASAEEKAEEKPARKEPIIFAPRPSPEPAEANGAAKATPDPVIFAPAKTEPAKGETAKTAEPVAEPAAATEPPVGAEPPAASAEPTVATEPPAGAEPVKPKATVITPAAEPVVEPIEPSAGTTTGPTAAEAATVPAVESSAEAATGSTTAEAATAKPKAAPKSRTAAKPKATKPKAAAKPAGTAKTGAGAKPEAAAKAEAEVKTVAEPAVKAATGAAAGLAEPLPGYSGLTVASLRARMRGKSTEQMTELLAYEQATAARPEVIRMFENRLAKLRAGE